MSGLAGSRTPGALFVAVGDHAAVTAGPGHDVVPVPDFAHVKHSLGLRPVRAVNELLDPLAAHAEQAADLSRSDELAHNGKHRHHATSHLTIGQRGYITSRVTSLDGAGPALPDAAIRAGLHATYEHISLLRRKQERLHASQVAAEEQFLHRVGQAYTASDLSDLELGLIYEAYATLALPGFMERWSKAVPVQAARMQYLRRHLRHVERNAPNMPDGTWQGTWPLDGCPVPLDGICVVYVLFDAKNNPCYVGSTYKLKTRLKCHRRDKPFVRWAAYRCEDREAAYRLEEKLLSEHKPYLNKKSYR